MESKRLRSLVLVGCLVSVVLGGIAYAESGQAEGQVVYVQHRSDEFELRDGSKGYRTWNKGVVTAEDPETPFHMSAQDCVGTTIVSADGEVASAGGYCDGIDRQGDVWLISWYDGYWTFLGGTGKYASIKGGGTTRQGPPMDGGRSIVFWTGEWITP
jgi:hypothetical protein